MPADEVVATPPRRRRWLRWFLNTAGVVIVAAIALSYFFLPRLGRPAIERALATALDTPVSIGALTWEPQNGRVTARQITIGAESDTNHLTIAQVVGEIRLARLWRRQIVVSRIAVADPVGAVELDARYRPTFLPKDDESAAGATLPHVTVEQLEVTGGRLTVRYPVKGRLHDKLLRIDKLDSANLVATADGVSMRGALDGALDGAPLNAQLQLAIDEVDADLAVSGLAVHRDTIDLPPGLDTFRATVDARAHYRSQTEPPSDTVQLDVKLDRPSITDAAGSELSATTIVVPDASIDLRTGAVVADRIAVEKPIGTLELDAQYRPALPRFGSAAAATTPARDVSIGELTATDGEVTLRYPVRGAPRVVPLRITRLQASEVKATGGAVALRAELEGSLDGAPLTGRVDLGGAPEAIDAEVDVSGLQVDGNAIELPAGLQSLVARVAVQAKYQKTASAGETVRISGRLEEPRLSGAAGSGFRARAVSVPDARLDLAARRVTLGAVQVMEPVIDMAITPNGIALPVPAASGSAGPGWTLASGSIELRDGLVHLRRGAAAIALRLQAVDWHGLAGDGPLTVRATTDKGGAITAQGTLGSDPLAATLDIQFDGLPLPPLIDVAGVLPVGLSRGTAEGRSRVVYSDGRLRAEGTVRVREVHTLPPDPARPTEVMAVAEAAAEFTVDTDAATAVDIASLKLSDPYLLAQRNRDGLFPASLFTTAPSNEDTPAAEAVRVRIRHIEVEHGKVEFLDATLKPAYWTSLNDFAAAARELRLPAASVASFSIAGKQDELSPIEIRGALTAEGLKGQASVQDVLLPALNAYVAPLLGYDLTSGRLGLDVSVVPAPPVLAATANVTLRGVEVQQTGVDVIQKQSGVPLPIALSLISKRSGEIDLTVPITVDTSARRVAPGSIVGQAVRNAIVTALTSPLRILGNLFGKHGAPHAFAIDPIPFAPGSGSLDEAGGARIAAIARILIAHPGLVLVALPQITAEDLAAVGHRAAALAEARSGAVRDALTGKDADPRLPPERLTLVAWEPADGAPPVEQPGVYVELQDQP
jgi:uncharacterized protein involved in outer membrane biogenesis